MSEIGWDVKAVEAPTYASEHMFDAYRGATTWDQVGVALVFGNDCYAQNMVKMEVLAILGGLNVAGLTVLGFGVDPDEYSWAMLVETNEDFGIDTLNDLVHASATKLGLGLTGRQNHITTKTIDKYRRRPDYSAN